MVSLNVVLLMLFVINSDELDKILDEGRDFTRSVAKEKFEIMKSKIGLKR